MSSEQAAAEQTEQPPSQLPEVSAPTETETTQSETTSDQVEPQPLQPTMNEETSEETAGPLRRLSSQVTNSKLGKVAANSSLGRRMSTSSAAAYIQPATDKAIRAVDSTLESEEAKRVATTSMDLLYAMTALTLLVLTWTVSSLETTLQIERPETTAADGSSGTREFNAAEQQQSTKERVIDLMHRYKAVSGVLIVKGGTYLREQATKAAEARKNGQTTASRDGAAAYDPHSLDKVVMNHAQKGAKLVKQVSAYSLSRASQFSGPGASAIKPTADYIISKLPDDAKKVVQDSKSPFE